MEAPKAVAHHQRYSAFISYAHIDAVAAKSLHRKLETFHIPKASAIHAPRRLRPVFLDRSELSSSPDLSAAIEQALRDADALIVVCSPHAAASRWVNEEVRQFRQLGREHRIFCYIVDGDPAGSPGTMPFPPALLEARSGHRALEPLAADIRPGKESRHDALLKIVAGLLDLPFDALKRRDQMRQQRRLVAIAATSTTLLLIMTGLAIVAVLARQQAERRYETAVRTATFTRDLFDAARPEVTGGRAVTVREMIDQATVETLRSPELAHEAEMRADLLTSLAQIYSKLGEYQRSDALAQVAGANESRDPDRALNLSATRAENAMLQADYAAARTIIDRALAAPASGTRVAAQVRRGLLIESGQVAVAEGDLTHAEAEFVRARAESLAERPADRDTAATALAAAALADADGGRLNRAEQRLRQVIAERREMGQDRHPDVLAANNALGVLAIKRGDARMAERYFRATMAQQAALFGVDHLNTLVTRGNLGRALVEQRRFGAARHELERARSGIVNAAGGDYDSLANIDDSLGLAQAGSGDPAAARASYARGLRIAAMHDMPKQAELLADGAELDCKTDARAKDGLAAVRRAHALLRRFDQPEPWRTARLDQVGAGCWLTLGNRARAAPLVRGSAAAVIARWGANSLFGQTARAQLRQIAVR